MTVEQFPIDKLPSYSKADAGMVNRLVELYDTLAADSSLLETARSALQGLTVDPVALEVADLRQTNIENLSATITAGSVVAVVRLGDGARKTGIAFDALLAKALTHKALSPQAKLPDKVALSFRPLTPLEEAVVQYVVVALLDQIGKSHPETTYVCEDVTSDIKKMATLFTSHEPLAQVVLSMRLATHQFQISIFLPMRLVETLVPPKSINNKASFSKYGFLPLSLCVDVGQVELSSRDLAQLQEGDIVLLDQCEAVLSGQNISGMARLRLIDEDCPWEMDVNLSQDSDKLSAILV